MGRPRPHLRARAGFGLRLAATLLAALASAAAVAYPLLSRALEHRLLAADWETAKAEAVVVHAAAEGDHGRPGALREINEALRVIAARPGTREAKLIEPSFRVAAGADPADVGTRDYDARLADAIRRGRAYSGREADPRADSRDFEYIVPLRLADGMHAFEITRGDAYLSAQLAAVRAGIGVAGVLGLLTALITFWPLGGGRLLRTHRLAVQHATLDGLTRLGNHRAFQDELGHAVARAGRHGEALSLLLFDLDDFKQANDRHGHRHGDDLLRRVAEVLRGARQSDRAFRIGGDEFAVVLAGTDEPRALAAAGRLVAELRERQVTVSIGASGLRAGSDAELLRQQADSALYEAKRRGGEMAVGFSEIAADVALVTRERAQALRDAIAQGAVTTVFQPIWQLHGAEDLLAVEALARIDARFGFAGPADAFDVAEQIGRVHDLDVLCVTRALERSAELPPGALLFVNLAPQTLAIAAFASQTGAQVIAEGIEDDDVLALVRRIDELIDASGPRIHAGQGYGLGRPAPEMPAARRVPAEV